MDMKESLRMLWQWLCPPLEDKPDGTSFCLIYLFPSFSPPSTVVTEIQNKTCFTYARAHTQTQRTLLSCWTKNTFLPSDKL